jgi:hypothetical protein
VTRSDDGEHPIQRVALAASATQQFLATRRHRHRRAYGLPQHDASD